MGEARRRGSYEERKSLALKAREEDEIRKKRLYEDIRKQKLQEPVAVRNKMSRVVISALIMSGGFGIIRQEK